MKREQAVLDYIESLKDDSSWLRQRFNNLGNKKLMELCDQLYAIAGRIESEYEAAVEKPELFGDQKVDRHWVKHHGLSVTSGVAPDLFAVASIGPNTTEVSVVINEADQVGFFVKPKGGIANAQVLLNPTRTDVVKLCLLMGVDLSKHKEQSSAKQ